uniref:Putative secreted protein n=1 Tax=Panstrongylus lignarius TaxID=156445 RepID=A0A224Y1Z0_9HEMI
MARFSPSPALSLSLSSGSSAVASLSCSSSLAQVSNGVFSISLANRNFFSFFSTFFSVSSFSASSCSIFFRLSFLFFPVTSFSFMPESINITRFLSSSLFCESALAIFNI